MHQMISGHDQVHKIQDAISESVLSFKNCHGRAPQSWCGAFAARCDQCRDADRGLRRASSSGRVHFSSSCRICSASTSERHLACLQEPPVLIVQVVQVPQVQLIEQVVEILEIQPDQGTQTSTSLGSALVRQVTFAETVEPVELEPPLPAKHVSPMCVTTPVVEAPFCDGRARPSCSRGRECCSSDLRDLHCAVFNGRFACRDLHSTCS